MTDEEKLKAFDRLREQRQRAFQKFKKNNPDKLKEYYQKFYQKVKNLKNGTSTQTATTNKG